MPINMEKINTGNTSDTSLHPREIFTALPGKTEGKFEYPRDVHKAIKERLLQYNLTADKFCDHYTTKYITKVQ